MLSFDELDAPGQRALELVQRRWTLRIIDDLLTGGPTRFSDLRARLVTVSPNVLSQRLKDLERADLVRRRQLPPPAASTVYELTRWGKDSEPTLRALRDWMSSARPHPRVVEHPIASTGG